MKEVEEESMKGISDGGIGSFQSSHIFARPGPIDRYPLVSGITDKETNKYTKEEEERLVPPLSQLPNADVYSPYGHYVVRGPACDEYRNDH